MSRRTDPWPAGTPCWVDLATTDVPAAQALYGDAFGWQFEEHGPEYGGYVTCTVDGQTVAGIGHVQPGAPPAWTLYLATDDIDAMSASVASNGGTLLAEPFDVGTLGRMAVAVDPGGAAFGMWQANEHIGSQLVNEPGGLVWEENNSADPDAARVFYTALFDFDHEAMPEAGPDYAMFQRKGEQYPLGGINRVPDGRAPHWLPYLATVSTDDSVAAAVRHGATVLATPMDTPYGRMAIISDPAGAVVACMQIATEQPDRSD